MIKKAPTPSPSKERSTASSSKAKPADKKPPVSAFFAPKPKPQPKEVPAASSSGKSKTAEKGKGKAESVEPEKKEEADEADDSESDEEDDEAAGQLCVAFGFNRTGEADQCTAEPTFSPVRLPPQKVRRTGSTGRPELRTCTFASRSPGRHLTLHLSQRPLSGPHRHVRSHLPNDQASRNLGLPYPVPRRGDPEDPRRPPQSRLPLHQLGEHARGSCEGLS